MPTGGLAHFRWMRSQNGSVAINVAIATLVLIGMVSIGIEVTFLFLKHRQMQAAADAGAIAAAASINSGQSAMTTEADAVASDSGFVPGVSGVTVTVNNPPQSGAHAGDSSAVEVIVAQPQTLGLAKLFHPDDFQVKARAVALIGVGGEFCVFGMDPAASGAVHLANNAGVNNPHCGVATNSGSASGLLLDNNAVIKGPVYAHGGAFLANGAAMTGSPIMLNAPVVADPYADVSLGAVPACTAQSGSVSGTVTLQPGHFCSGWNLGNSARVTLQPGTYYIDTKLDIGNTVRITGTGGVTLVINGNYTISWGNSTYLTLTAPTSGAFSGLAIYSPATNSSSLTQRFENNIQMTIIGAIYFPSQSINFSNNAVVNATRCTQIIGRTVDLSNNVALNNDCGGTGVGPIGTSSHLVE